MNEVAQHGRPTLAPGARARIQCEECLAPREARGAAGLAAAALGTGDFAAAGLAVADLAAGLAAT
ncbi:hypothetical protein, partial [Burkholderia sp. Tr-860]|uniref:hypothetical protein n=1 Tax=Burkholderia sp. Tr-860 TaxID=2608338 RepID=UPI0019656863